MSLPGQHSATTWPLISVVIPCYNQARFLPDCIGSLAAQNTADLEVIIVDDGSSDNTAEVGRELAAAWPALVIRLLRQPNLGLAEARNAGIRMAHGTWIQLLDSDDMLAAGWLNTLCILIAQRQDADMISGALSRFGAVESDWALHRYDPKLLELFSLITGTSPFRKALWEKVGGYDPSNPWGMEDWHFWLKCREAGWMPVMADVPMLHYRIHEHGSMFQELKKREDEAMALHRTMLPAVYGVPFQLTAMETIRTISPESQDRIRRKSELFPERPYPWLWMSLFLHAAGQLEDALVCGLKAHAFIGQAGMWQTLFVLSALYHAMGNAKKGDTAREACFGCNPALRDLLMN